MIKNIANKLGYAATAIGAGTVAAGVFGVATAIASANSAVATGAAIGAAVGAGLGYAGGIAAGGVGILMSGGTLGFVTFGVSKVFSPTLFAGIGSVIGSTVGAGIGAIVSQFSTATAVSTSMDLMVSGGLTLAIGAAIVLALKAIDIVIEQDFQTA